MELWYRKPAERWCEALPLGNGRLGAMVYGGVFQERISLNEESVWSGKPLDRINPDARRFLPEIREHLRAGRIAEAQRLSMRALSGTPQSARAYQTAGELLLHFDADGDVPPGQYAEEKSGPQYSDYRRTLHMDTGTAELKYRCGDTVFRRSYGISCPDQCMFVHLTTEDGTPFSFHCRLERAGHQQDESGSCGEDGAYMYVDAPAGGIPFHTLLRVKATGGSVTSAGGFVAAEQVTEATILLDIETGFRHAECGAVCRQVVDAAYGKSIFALMHEHEEDFRTLFSRMSLKFKADGPADDPAEELATDERLKRAAAGETDRRLLEQYFQFARYLMIAGSREGTLPLNLQGIWNDQLYPAWDSKYTININTEMNYWMAESANLAECHLPLFELLDRVCENGKATAERMYGCRGSAAHHNTDIYADTAPQDIWIPSTYWVMGEAWLATHIWRHYLYTQDLGFLKEHFEVLEQCVLFFEDFLIEDREGYLVTSPSVSPENTYQTDNGATGAMCEGATMDIEILRDLFEIYCRACVLLHQSEDKIGAARELLRRLPPLQIGSDGRLLEWRDEYREPEPGHRHISHLFGVYPGCSITWEDTPELMEAAQKALEHRLSHGGGHTGWSRAWIIVLWANFRRGERAFENLKAILTMGTFPNLMDTHPVGDGYVFQIDGNMGAAAGMLEMLVQSREGRLHLLPALPEELADGELLGMRICGNAILDMKWERGKVSCLRIMPGQDMKLLLTKNGETQEIQLHRGSCFTQTEETAASV